MLEFQFRMTTTLMSMPLASLDKPSLVVDACKTKLLLKVFDVFQFQYTLVLPFLSCFLSKESLRHSVQMSQEEIVKVSSKGLVTITAKIGLKKEISIYMNLSEKLF